MMLRLLTIAALSLAGCASRYPDPPRAFYVRPMGVTHAEASYLAKLEFDEISVQIDTCLGLRRLHPIAYRRGSWRASCGRP